MAGTTARGARRTNEIDMLNGPLLGKILAFAFPLALTGVLQQLFNAADTAVAGQFVSGDALAAVGANSPIIGLLVNLFTGLSVGANVLLATAVGTQDHRRLREGLHTALALSLACGLALVAIGLLAAEPLHRLIGTPDDVAGLAVDYLRVYFIGMPFSMFYNFAAAALRSKGDTRRPLYALVASTVVNVALDLLFTCVFGWGVRGVAAATVIANAVSAAVLLAVLLDKSAGDFRLHPRELRIKRTYLAPIVKIGLPAGVQGAVFSLSNVCIQAAINGFGPDAMAGAAASLNYELFTYYLVNAFAQTAVTFTSQNYALRNFGRCDRVFALCMTGGIVAAGLSIAVFVGMGETFVGIFATEAAAIQFGVVRMVHVELYECIGVLYEVAAGAMRGMGHSLLPATITLIGSCLLRFAWIYLVFPHFGTWESLVNVYPVTWVVTSVAMLAAYAFVRRAAYRR